MGNSIKIVRSSEYIKSIWSGGTTTQLLIWPEDAIYSERNFKWRVSSAKVEDEESVFTHLPGFSRILMAVEGNLMLSHEGRYDVTLKPYDQDSFMGDWMTKSFGKATDFNLMMSEGCSGELNVLSLEGRSLLDFALVPGNKISRNTAYVFYAVNGDMKVKINNEEYDIQRGSLISVMLTEEKQPLEIKLSNKCDREIKIIEAVIHY